MSDNNKAKSMPLKFGTSGIRGSVKDMTDRECYINMKGFIRYLLDIRDIAPGGTISIAGDLRQSTPRIMRAVAAAIIDSKCKVDNCGFIPTPALAYYAGQRTRPAIMVTGSHIPDDRNGIKPYRSDGEVLKSDEASILEHISRVREEEERKTASESIFEPGGMLKKPVNLPPVNIEAEQVYIRRYLDVFPADSLKGKTVILYEHSSVGRDILYRILKGLGAEVIRAARSDKFIPIDTENITEENMRFLRQLAGEHRVWGVFAIVSADGDSDRPLVVDENGLFHRGDIVGIAASRYLGIDFAAIPISSNDAVAIQLAKDKVAFKYTRIGSPYVIAAMNEAIKAGKHAVAGWEVNGGFLTGTDFKINKKVLKALPTRDAVLPVLCVLLEAIKHNQSISQLLTSFPRRFTQAGLIDNFPVETSRKIIEQFSPPAGSGIVEVQFSDGDMDLRGENGDEIIPVNERIIKELKEKKARLSKYFGKDGKFGEIVRINFLDGIRMTFDNRDIGHMRPSGNAPQFRFYANADTQPRADEIVKLAIAEPDGILRRMERDLTGGELKNS